ncbi:MAG: adenylate/guanylate cyclase domain-containing protein [Rhodospirillaceae bacterium]
MTASPPAPKHDRRAKSPPSESPPPEPSASGLEPPTDPPVPSAPPPIPSPSPTEAKSSARTKIPLRLSLFAAFGLLLGGLGVGIGLYSYDRNREASLQLAETLLATANGIVVERLSSTLNPVVELVNLMAEVPVVASPWSEESDPAAARNAAAVEQLLTAAMVGKPQIFSLYTARTDGGFQRLITLSETENPKDGETRSLLLAPTATQQIHQRTLRASSGRLATEWAFFDRDLQALGQRRIEPVLPWSPADLLLHRHREAQEVRRSGHAEILGFHVLPGLRRIVTAVVHPVTGPDGDIVGLVGADVSLDGLSEFFQAQRPSPGARQVIADAQGRVLVHSVATDVVKTLRGDGGLLEIVPRTIEELDDEILTEAHRQFQAGQLSVDTPQSLGYEGGLLDLESRALGSEQIALVTRLPNNLFHEAYLITTVPVDDFVAPVRSLRFEVLSITGVAVLIGLGLAGMIAQAVARPLMRLTKEVEEIRSFNLDAPLEVESRILEVHRLSVATGSMKEGLKTFGLYVPKALVTRIVSSGTAPERGGERRPLTVLFTDIVGFTDLSERTQPEVLNEALSSYFTVLGHELGQRGGVIDKYVGDAVMAFWNAPDRRDNHVLDGLAAMLAARKAVAAFNEERIRNGDIPFKTRFGLHVGPCVVGNVGTPDRLNYTALGDAVNVASRLEGINKTYGTEVLVSGAVVQAVGQAALFRLVDRVAPRGRNAAVELYEPLGLSRRGVLEQNRSLCITPDVLEPMRIWGEAMALKDQGDLARALAAFEAYQERFGPDGPAAFQAEACRSALGSADGSEAPETGAA